MFARTAIAASRTSCTAFDQSSAARRRRSNLAAVSGEGDLFIPLYRHPWPKLRVPAQAVPAKTGGVVRLAPIASALECPQEAIGNSLVRVCRLWPRARSG